MERTVEYLRECGVFFVAAADGDRPCVEPVGEAGLFDGAVYISVRRETALYRALKKMPRRRSRRCIRTRAGSP